MNQLFPIADVTVLNMTCFKIILNNDVFGIFGESYFLHLLKNILPFFEIPALNKRSTFHNIPFFLLMSILLSP